MAEQITMRVSLGDKRAYCATFRIEAKVEPQSRSEAKAESGLNRDDSLYPSVCPFVRSIFGLTEQITMQLSLGDRRAY
ncbi:hypothetical protein EVAR_33739_1 [Eumeta japonica]|uniref:Uncharacterized protein n=1 Tax=Eumeta variegata TaxID=151549 RepID=A0A4C1VRM5_EUMVA|nr:hypothetical protein EVAR_33739_1 [Eumeta japonica]